MNKTRTMIWMALAMFPSLTSAAGVPPECDRQCLAGIADAYMRALTANDPAAAPLDQNVRFTENGQELMIGDALWGTADRLRDYRIRIADPESRQIAIIGIVEEGSLPGLLAVRLKISGRKVSEAEHVIARSSNPSAYAKLKTPRSAFARVLPKDARSDRKTLVRIANAYFDGIENDTAQGVPFSKDCNRLENGLQTTNNPNLTLGHDLDPREAEAVSNAAALGCRAQFERGGFDFISEITPRRFAVVDEERGLVFGIFGFVHDGRHMTMTLSDGSKVPTPTFATVPNNVLMAEVFRIENGRIHEIEAVGANVPYRSGTGWPDQD